ncbi:CMRF35-like molecule 5 [Astyanax mexicanus]|uniref:CMRF35-like molecule 5 n=1 Tax=Astyanax mexicanus TaxID=7994 RepID=A0A8T2LM41_ASTMX|nr:CMRF35-like molecule 5 [Astyanax mexicanus]
MGLAAQKKTVAVFTGTEGGSVEINCSYKDSYIYSKHYFCRDPCRYFDVLIETQKADIVVSKGRYSILNTVNAQSVSVTIKNLRLTDSGVYYCGVDKRGSDIFTKVEISVRKAQVNLSTTPQTTGSTETFSTTNELSTTAKPTWSSAHILMGLAVQTKTVPVFTGTEGGSVEIYCRYRDSYQYSKQYFCRAPCRYSDVLIETQKADIVVSKGRYSILNTVTALSVSVTIKNLRLTDSGVYYCGVDQWGSDTLTEVQISVKKAEANLSSTPQTTGSTGSKAELEVFGVLFGVVCANMVFLLLFLYKTSAPPSCSPVI